MKKINEQDSDNDNTDVKNESVENAKKTTQVFEQETTSTAVTTSLPAGTYRYRITKYDLLGRQAKVSEWFTLVIQKLAKPEIIKLLPTSPIFVEHESLVFSIEGLNVIEESKITLISEDKKTVFEVKIQNIDNSSNKIQIQIDNFDNALVEGNYVLHIDNPENLSCTSEVFKLKKAIDPDKVPVITKTEKVIVKEDKKSEPTSEPKKEVKTEEAKIVKEPEVINDLSDVYFAFGGILVQDIYNDTAFTHKSGELLWGFTGEIGFVPIKKSFGYIGFNVFVDYMKSSQKEDSYTINLEMTLANLNITYEKPFCNNKIRLGANIGFGMSLIGWDIKYSSGILASAIDKTYYTFFDAQVGISFSFYPVRFILLKAEANYVHIFAPDMPTGLIIPSVLVGFRL